MFIVFLNNYSTRHMTLDSQITLDTPLYRTNKEQKSMPILISRSAMSSTQTAATTASFRHGL